MPDACYLVCVYMYKHALAMDVSLAGEMLLHDLE